MVRLKIRRLIATVLTVTANGCAAGAGALLALVTVGAINWTPILFAFLAGTALCFSISAEIVENPKEGPKHAAR
jgi:zinc transporter ZupT